MDWMSWRTKGVCNQAVLRSVLSAVIEPLEGLYDDLEVHATPATQLPIIDFFVDGVCSKCTELIGDKAVWHPDEDMASVLPGRVWEVAKTMLEHASGCDSHEAAAVGWVGRKGVRYIC